GLPQEYRVQAALWSARRLAMHRDDYRDAGGRSALRQVGQAKLYGHRPAYQKAYGNRGPGVSQRNARLHRPREQSEEAVLRLVQFEPHAHLDSPEARGSRE